MKIIRSQWSAAVSPIIATIVLLALTIAGGFLVWGILTNYIRISSTNAQVTVASAQLTVIAAGSASGPGIFNFTITNSGSVAAVVNAKGSCLTMTLYNGTNQIVLPLDVVCPLAPGKTAPLCYASAALKLTDPDCSAIPPSIPSSGWTTFEVQHTYDYTLSASFSGGSTYVSSGTILAVGS